MNNNNELNKLDSKLSESAKGIIDGLKRIENSAKKAGIGLIETLLAIILLKLKTGRSTSVIGNSLKSIFTAIECEDINKCGIYQRVTADKLFETLEEFSRQGMSLDKSEKTAVQVANLTGQNIKSTCEGLAGFISSLQKEEDRSRFLDFQKTKDLLSTCKESSKIYKKTVRNELFKALHRVFPILRMAGQVDGKYEFYLGAASVCIYYGHNKKPTLEFVDGPAKFMIFSDEKELGHLLSMSNGKELEKHILGIC